MARYAIAATAALIALSFAGPAAAKVKPAAAPPACAVPAANIVDGLRAPPDGAVEDQIKKLTGVIADLQNRIATLEDALGQEDDGDADADSDDFAGQSFDLAKAHGAPRPGLTRGSVHGKRHSRPQNRRSWTVEPIEAL